jgi:hypothetical protein
MIGRVSGVLAEKHPPQILVEAAGIGYEIEVPMSTFYNLPASGERVTLLTHLVVREDAHLLYNFATDPGGVPCLPPAAEDFRRRPAYRARRALRDERGRAGPRTVAAQSPGAWSRSPGSARRPPSACCSSSRASSVAKRCPGSR